MQHYLVIMSFILLHGCLPSDPKGADLSATQRLLVSDARVVFPIHEHPVDGIALAPEGTPLLAISLFGQELNVVNLESGQNVWTKAVGSEDGRLHNLSFSPDGRTLLENRGYQVNFYNAADGKEIRSVGGGNVGSSFQVAAFTPDGKSALLSLGILGPDRSLFLIELESLQEKNLETLSLWGNWLSSIQISADRRFAAGTIRYKKLEVVIWDLVNGAIDRKISIDQNEVRGDNPIALSKDFRFAARAAGGRVEVFDLEAQIQVRDWKVGPASIGFRSIHFSSDGCCVIAAGQDRMAHVWRLSDGQELASLDGRFDDPPNDFTDMALAGQYSRLYVGSQKGAVYEWPLSPAGETPR